MPQDTRPRTVTPQDQQIAPPNNELADILARAGVVPFNPNGGADLNTIIQGLLQPTPAPVPQKEGLLQTILSSLGSGVAAATQNPVLQQQLQTQQAQKFAAQQQERDASDRLNQIRQQFGLRLLDSQLGEQQDLRKEARTNAYKKEERIAAEQAAIREFNMQMAGKEQLENWNFNHQKALKDIDLNYQRSRDARVDDRFEKKEAQDLIERKLQIKLGLVTSGIPAGLATNIANKWFADEPLSPSEERALTASAQRSLAQAAKAVRSGGSGGGSSSTVGRMSEKDKMILIRQAVNDQYFQLKNPDGTPGAIVESSGVPRDVTGSLNEGAIYRRLSKEENGEYAATKVIPAIMAAEELLRNPKPKATQVAPKVKGLSVADGQRYGPEVNVPVTPQQKAYQYEEQLNAAIKEGYAPTVVAKKMLEFVQQNAPEDKVIVEGIISKKIPQKSKTSLMRGNKTGAQLKKEADAFLRKGASN